jgi:hypothetical protein
MHDMLTTAALNFIYMFFNGGYFKMICLIVRTLYWDACVWGNGDLELTLPLFCRLFRCLLRSRQRHGCLELTRQNFGVF